MYSRWSTPLTVRHAQTAARCVGERRFGIPADEAEALAQDKRSSSPARRVRGACASAPPTSARSVSTDHLDAFVALVLHKRPDDGADRVPSSGRAQRRTDARSVTVSRVMRRSATTIAAAHVADGSSSEPDAQKVLAAVAGFACEVYRLHAAAA